MRKILICLAALALLAGPAWARTGTAKSAAEVEVGSVKVKMSPPEGLIRVDGLVPEAEAYIRLVEPKFKLKVLALYAGEAEWKDFVARVSARKPASIPRLAMICVPAKMGRKSFSAQAVRQEHRRYDRWFSAVASNRPMAALLTSQGNKKLKEYLGVDIGFKLSADEFTKKFAENSRSLSVGSQVSFKLFGQSSRIFLTTTSLAVADKMIFLAYFEQSGSADHLQAVRAKSLLWRDQVAAQNPFS